MPGFINPYHFVPLANGPERLRAADYTGELSGSVECELSLRTPMALPDHSREDKQKYTDTKGRPYEHSSFPFHRSPLTGRPEIPGSEIRGMVRSVYEAATDSCLCVFDNSEMSGRSAKTRPYAALLYRDAGVWYLQPAKLFMINTFLPVNQQSWGTPARYRINYARQEIIVGADRYRTGDMVSFTPGAGTYKTSRGFDTHVPFAALGAGTRTGCLLVGERGLPKNRHNSHLFEADTAQNPFAIPDECVENLKALLELYRSDEVNKALNQENAYHEKQHTGYKSYTVRDDGGMTPVFYSKMGTRYYLSPSMKTREVYYRRLHEVAGDYVPCGIRSGTAPAAVKPGDDALCPACALFGTMTDSSAIAATGNILRNSYGSRLRFSDAQWITPGEPAFLKRDGKNMLTLPELSGPKITSSEFYTHLRDYGDQDRLWNTDYKTTDRGTQILNPGDILLNGRKFFWHHPLFAQMDAPAQAARLKPRPDMITGREQTKRNVTTQLLREGKFRFTVYFDRIRESDLKTLLWVLSPVDGERDLCHKLGFAKPLGCGSVKVGILDVRTRSFTGEDYRIDDHNDWITERSRPEKAPQELIELLDFNRTGTQEVCYPIGSERGESGSHLWFKTNRTFGDGVNAENPRICYTLPRITARGASDGSDLALPEAVDKRFIETVRTSSAPAAPAVSPAGFEAAARRGPGESMTEGTVVKLNGRDITVQTDKGKKFEFTAVKIIPPSVKVFAKVCVEFKNGKYWIKPQ